jgi:mannosyltransferase OCH1-like enzyme
MKSASSLALYELVSLTAVRDTAPGGDRRKAIAMMMGLDSTLSIKNRLSAIEFCQHALPTAMQTKDVGPIWQFWGQGLEAAPPIVSACVRSVAENAGGRKHIVLTAETVADYLDLPAPLLARREFWGWTKFSNILRLLLLEQYGGTWIDATVYLAAPLPQFVAESEFFVFQRDHDPRILANWFIHTVAGHPLISACRAAYEQYWTAATVPGDYFMFHFIFEALVLSSRELQASWRRMPYREAAPLHELQSALDKPYSPDRWRAITARSSIQKLSYKLDPSPSAEKTFRQHICSPAPAAARP